MYQLYLSTAAALFAVALTAQADTRQGCETPARIAHPQGACAAAISGLAGAGHELGRREMPSASHSRQTDPSPASRAGLRRIGLAAEVLLLGERERLLGSRESGDGTAAHPASQRENTGPLSLGNGRWLYPADPDGNTYRSNDGDRYIRQGAFIINPDTGHILYRQ